MSEALPAHRLHPLSWVFHALRALREVALPILVFMLAGRKAAFVPLIIGAIAAVVLIAWGVIRSRTFRYELLERELLVREGLFVRETRHVPFTRIQSVNERQGLLHRLLGVTELELESGSAGRPEAVMRVLGTAEAAHIATVLRSASPGQGVASGEPASDGPATAVRQEAEPMQRLLEVPTGELVIHGIISNRGLLVVAFAAGIIAQNSDLLELLPIGGLLDRIDLEKMVGSGAETAAGFSVGAMIGALLVLVLGLLVFVRVLSVAYAVVTLHGFTLQRSGDRLRVTRGLLSRVDVSGRVSGFQRLVLKQSLLHRVFDRCALEADLAGSSFVDGDTTERSRLDTLAPIATPEEAQSLLDGFVPGVRVDALDWRPLHRSAALRRWQRTLYWLLPLLAAALAGAWLMPGASMTALGVVAACAAAALATSVWHAHRWAQWSAFAVTEGVVVWRSGVLARRWVVVFDDRAQSTTLRRSPRDRREDTASLSLDVQSMTATHALRIPYLDAAEAARLNGRFWVPKRCAPATAVVG